MAPSVISAGGSSLHAGEASVAKQPDLAQHASSPIRAGVAWEIWCGALAVTSAIIGVEWDISWHSSIGRDTFWTPAHMMIYFCGVMTAAVCAYLVLVTTFSKSSRMRSNSVHIFGFRAPLGGFIATWGGLAMLVSAPFDNWWHNAYGLDVQVLSPPHVLLFFGLAMIASGFLLLTGGALNCASANGDAQAFTRLQILFLYLGGLNLMMYMIILEERTDRWLLHNTMPYKTLAVTVPFLLAVLSGASRHRWAATWAATVYSIMRILAILILPLVPATPKLGPVFTPVTHMMPAQFPILLIVPAFALDLLWQFTAQRRLWLRGLLSGIVFVATLTATEWPFANFLVSRAAANRFFGTLYTGYTTHVADRAPHLSLVQSGWPLWHGLLIATVSAVCVSYLGLHIGRWSRQVQR